jgi:hypothetical protein
VRRFHLAVLCLTALLFAGPAAGQPAPHLKPLSPTAGFVAYGQVHDGHLVMTMQAINHGPSWGGVYYDSAGEAIKIQVSTVYPQDPATAQKWADFFGGLVHGSELALLNVYVTTPDEIHTLCGTADAEGCYDPNSETMLVPGQDDTVNGIPAESVVRHEYGHHIELNRINTPWDAYTWGPKRWATYERVCERVKQGKVFPGDEGSHYTLNPAEAFAEDYRMLNERQSGLPDLPWMVVESVFFPDAGTLAAVKADVLSPWAAPGLKRFKGRLTATHKRLVFRLPTNLDGGLAVDITAPKGARTTLGFDGQPYATATTRITANVCGSSYLTVTVNRGQVSGSVDVRVTLPF